MNQWFSSPKETLSVLRNEGRMNVIQLRDCKEPEEANIRLIYV